MNPFISWNPIKTRSQYAELQARAINSRLENPAVQKTPIPVMNPFNDLGDPSVAAIDYVERKFRESSSNDLVCLWSHDVDGQLHFHVQPFTQMGLMEAEHETAAMPGFLKWEVRRGITYATYADSSSLPIYGCGAE